MGEGGPTLPLLALVEDNCADVDLVRLGLEDCSIDVRVFSDGQSAIDFATGPDLPDGVLFVVDLNLPRRSGFEVLQAISDLQANPRRVQALVLSSSPLPADRERALALGARDFIGKPNCLAEVRQLGSQLCEMLQELQPD